MPKLTSEQVLHLLHGDDRGGLPRTWAEVAQHLERSQGYIQRIAQENIDRPIAKVWFDPRQAIADLKEILSDEDVERWNENPTCLCGCGIATLQERGKTCRVPRGAFRLFKGNHEKRMPWVVAVLTAANQGQDRRRRQSVTARENNVRVEVIAELVLEWRTSGGGTFEDLAHYSGVTANHVRDIVYGRHERIHKRTAARLLAGIGEPLRPELAAEFERWRYETWLRNRDLLNAR